MKRLQSLSYKTLFAILFFTLAGIVFFLKIGSKTQKVSAAWWDNMWHYRKAINITNSSGSDLTDFQVSFSIGTSQLVADGKMQSDCDDIRITDINGNLLPHWIETNGLNACNQTNSVVWVKTASLPISDSTIYIYYGNPSASSISNGNNVFIFFDDFNNPTIDTNKWDLSGNMISISNNRLRSDRANGTGSLFSKTTYTRPFILDMDFFPTQYPAGWEGSYHGSTSFGTFDGSKNYEHAWTPYGGGGNSYCGFCDDGGCYHGQYVNPLVTGDTLYKISMQAQTLQSGPQGVMTYSNRKDDGTGSQASGTIYTGATTGADPLYIGVKDYGSNITDDFEWDNWRIRKYAPSEPTSSPQPEESGGGPIAYWKFNEGSGTTAYDSAGNNNGTLESDSSSPTWADESQCVNGRCLFFNGTQSASSNYDVSWNNTNNISISFWVKPQNTSDTQKGILGKQSPSYEWSFYQSGSAVSFVHWDNTGSHANGMDDTWGNVLTANKWTHLVYSWDGSINRFYANGKLVKTKTATNPAININRTNNMMFGGNIYTWGNSYFQGYIDEVKIYPYARTADQIKLDYNSRGSSSGAGVNLGTQSNTAPSLKSSLIAHYKFDEGSGTTTYDSSGNNNTGTFGTGNSAPTWINDGKFNKAISFDGLNDYIQMNSFNLTPNSYTVSFWSKRNTVTNSYGSIFSMTAPYANALWVYENGNIGFGNANGNWKSWSSIWTDKTKYHHIVIAVSNVGTSSESTLYFDGVNKGSKITDTSGTLSNIKIGQFITNNTTNFPGLIDEVKIYNRALTTEEIKQDYNSGSAIQFGTANQTIGGTITSLDYCIPGDTSYCAPPVAEWNFEENTGTTAHDTSSNNNNGTFGTGESAPAWTTGQNNKGSAVNFTKPSSYINTSASFSDNYTVETWVKPSDLSITEGLGRSVIATTNNYPIWILVKGNRIRAYAYSNNTGANYTDSVYSNIQTNNWYHLTLTATRNGTAQLYINGQLDSTFTAGNQAATSSICIGDLRPGRNIPFLGSIDNTKIYNYIRTPAQIAYDYNRGAPIAWWKFDECQGSVINDSSGNGNTGALSIGQSGIQNSPGNCQAGTSAAWTNGANGKINSSLNFDGVDDRITFNDSSYLDITGSISISFWIKGLSSNSVSRGIIEKSNNSSFFGSYPNVSYQIGELNNNKVRFLFNNGVSDANTGQVSTNKTDWDINTWYQITATWDGSTNTNGIKIYINGTIDNQATSPVAAIQNTSGALNIAGKGTNYNFNGQIDDIRIYNYALTDEQIKLIYNGGSVNFN